MKKTLWKDTFREIRSSISRFLAILFIILIGVAFYVGIRSTGADMLKTADDYFKAQHLMDVQVRSTIGLTEADLDFIKDHVEGTIQPHVTKDVILDETKNTVRLYSLEEGPQAINAYRVTSGRLPEKADEIALDDAEWFKAQFKIGDTIAIEPPATDEEDADDLGEIELKQTSFKVVGFIRSPLFIEVPSRGNSLIGSGTLQAFAAVSPKAFDSDRYTEAFLTINATKDQKAYSSAYKKTVDRTTTQLKKTLNARAKDQQAEITGDIEQEIAEGEADLEKGRKDLENGRQKLKDAREKLAQGQKDLANGQAELAKKRQDGRQKLDQGWAEWQEGRDKLANKKQQLQAGQATLDDKLQELAAKKEQLKQLEAGLGALENGRQEIANAQKQLDAKKAEYEQGQAALSDLKKLLALMDLLGTDELQGYQRQDIKEKIAAIEAAGPELEDAQATLDAKKQALEEKAQELADWDADKLAQAWKELQAGEQQLDEKAQELTAGRQKLEAAEQEVAAGQAELNQQETRYANEIENAEARLANAEAELADGQAEYDEQQAAFADKEKEAEAKLADGEAQIADAKKLLREFPKVTYYVNDRNDNPGYSEYEDNTKRMDAIAAIFPVFFFFIAILISLTTMTRMVDEEREYIGVMKALGYRPHEILTKFVTYAFLATTIGAVLGLAIGYPLFPRLIYDGYSSLYNLPDIKTQTYPLYTAVALGASYLATVVATLVAVAHSLRQNAATLLRPKAPKAGKRIWLERLTPLWRRLSFNYKITFRNLFRYKMRMLMTIFGIAGSCGLMLTGFGLGDSVSDIPALQFDELNDFQAIVALKEDLMDEEVNDFEKYLEKESLIDDSLAITQETTTAKRKGINMQDVTLYALHDPEKVTDFLKMQNVKTKKQYTLKDGEVFMTAKLAELLKVKPGDSVTVHARDQEEWTFKISEIVENYLGHYLYMTPATFEQITGREAQTNLNLLQYNTEKHSEQAIGEALLDQDAVLGVTHTPEIRRAFTDTIDSLNVITNVLIISAALLAFTVLYNLTNINVAERVRELSTIKVLGFHDREVTAYIYRENIFLTLMGIGVGYLFGYFLHDFLIKTTEIDMMRFSRHIEWLSYAKAAGLTILFATVVMLIVHRKLKKINMVDALKGGD